MGTRGGTKKSGGECQSPEWRWVCTTSSLPCATINVTTKKKKDPIVDLKKRKLTVNITRDTSHDSSVFTFFTTTHLVYYVILFSMCNEKSHP